MSDIGRRVKFRYSVGNGQGTSLKLDIHGNTKCGLIGDYGTVVSVSTSMYFVTVDGCDCNKPHGGGCDGLNLGTHFEWTGDAPKESSIDGLCTCDWDVVYGVGCQCGGK